MTGRCESQKGEWIAAAMSGHMLRAGAKNSVDFLAPEIVSETFIRLYSRLSDNLSEAEIWTEVRRRLPGLCREAMRRDRYARRHTSLEAIFEAERYE